MLPRESYDDLATMAEIISDVARERESKILDRDKTRNRLEQAQMRSRARGRAWGKTFSRRGANALLWQGEHQMLMHQQI